jgi:putative peptidoglycan lipid II flippase
VRVALTTVLGYLFAIPLPRALGISDIWGAAGLTASAGIAGWAEMWLLRRRLNSRVGHTGLPAGYLLRLWTAAASGAAIAWLVRIASPGLHPILQAAIVLTPYGVVFFAIARLLEVPEASALIGRLRTFTIGG